MRIIRFLDGDGRVHHGEEHEDGTATILHDPQGVLGATTAAERRLMFRGRLALIADDDENMREMMSTVLTRVGCECTICSDGAQAMEAIEKKSIDLVVSDIVMPHFNGYEIFSAAQRKSRDTPVVLVTGFGYDPNHSLVRASQEGLTNVLYKPFTPQELLDELDKAIRVATPTPAAALVRSDRRPRVKEILAPLEPVNVICIGRNYGESTPAPGRHVGGAHRAGHAEDLEVFMKPSTAVQSPGGPIRLPACGETDPHVHGEGELAIVIGMKASEVSEEDALQHVLGYTAANDVTARRWQSSSGTPIWMRGKGFDTFCPLGPAIVTPDELGDPGRLTVRTMVNGETIRVGTASSMIRSVARIISDLSRHITLRPGTVILTGGPPLIPAAGHDPPHLVPGDEVVIEIDGIGRLVNRVESASVAT